MIWLRPAAVALLALGLLSRRWRTAAACVVALWSLVAIPWTLASHQWASAFVYIAAGLGALALADLGRRRHRDPEPKP